MALVGWPCRREAVVDHVIALDAGRVLNDPGRSVRIVAVDRLLEKIAHVRLTRRVVSIANPGYPAARLAATACLLTSILHEPRTVQFSLVR
jgi:hypothetical protein